MISRWPSTVSSLHPRHARNGIRIATTSLSSRQYSSTVRKQQQQQPGQHQALNPHEKSALAEINGLRRIHPVNPPVSTLPPPLKLPERDGNNVATYYYRIGRAYGSFYWVGVKAVWFNYQASKALRERTTKEIEAVSEKSIAESMWLDHLKRSEFQLLGRNNYDIGKLPLFGVLVCLFGEWLPLIVPFIPSAVPGTCRIPKQIKGMTTKSEERRKMSFRQGISEPSKEQMPVDISEHLARTEWPMVEKAYARVFLDKLRDDQLHHLSCTLNNHNRLWDRIQLPPPSALLRRGLSRRLSYLTSDDKLLIRDGGTELLSPEELTIACGERGLDVLGKSADKLRKELSWWLDRQQDDKGRGNAIFTMLFRRPNTWKT